MGWNPNRLFGFSIFHGLPLSLQGMLWDSTLDYGHFQPNLTQFINRPRIAGCGIGHCMASNIRMTDESLIRKDFGFWPWYIP